MPSRERYFCLQVVLSGLAAAVAGTLPGSFTVEANYRFILNVDSEDQCDYNHRSCAPLSDLWGWKSSTTSKSYALVGVLNGLSVIDVTDYASIHETLFFKGCLTEWRDIKSIKDHVFVVNDKTSFCDCVQQPCQRAIQITNWESLGLEDGFLAATEGSFSKPLAETEPVTAAIAATTPANGCADIENDLTGKVAIMPRGECDFATKVRHAENAGAVAAIIYNDRQDTVPPTMGGMSEGIEIPAVMITKADGEKLLELSTGENAQEVLVQMDEAIMRNNDHFSVSDGLVIIDLGNSAGPKKVFQSRKFFSFAHNIFADEDRSILWACGTSCGTDDAECTNYTPNGGILALDVSDPANPKLLAVWDDVYIHDVVVQKLGDRYVLFAAAIENARVYRFDVTDAKNLGGSVVYWVTPDMAHNTWPTMDQDIIYVTHEDDAMPVTIWNIEDITDVKYLGNFSVNIANATIPHNVFIRQNLIWMSYYSEGVVVYDISDAPHPRLLAHYDTSQFINGFHGVWGIYPLPDNRHAYASDIEAGLFVLRLEGDIPSADSNTDSNSNKKDSTSSSPNPAAAYFFSGVAFGLIVAAVLFYAGKASQTRFLRGTPQSGSSGTEQAQREDQEQRAPLVLEMVEDNKDDVDDDDLRSV